MGPMVVGKKMMALSWAITVLVIAANVLLIILLVIEASLIDSSWSGILIGEGNLMSPGQTRSRAN